MWLARLTRLHVHRYVTHGKAYQYPHSFEGHWVAQQYLPDSVADRRLYDPSDQGYEAQVKERVKKWREGGNSEERTSRSAGVPET